MGIGQCEVTTLGNVGDYAGRYIEALENIRHKENLDWTLLMITDVLSEGTHLLYVGSDEVIRQAFSEEPVNNHIWLPGVMSRKKQLIPMLTALWG